MHIQRLSTIDIAKFGWVKQSADLEVVRPANYSFFSVSVHFATIEPFFDEGEKADVGQLYLLYETSHLGGEVNKRDSQDWRVVWRAKVWNLSPPTRNATSC